jgi:hypothetical protein
MRPPALAFAVALAVVTVPAYPTSSVVIHVDDDAAPGGNGSGAFPYRSLPEAVAAAHGVSGAVVIKVEPGNYPLAETLVVDRSLELRGSTQQVVSNDRWPTGEVVPGTETRVFSTNPSLAQVIRVGRSDGGVLSDVSITGFVVEGNPIGANLLLTRVQDYWVADNVFRAPGNFAMQSIASSGRVTRNHFSGVATGAIFAGGYPASPSNVVVTGNRSVRNNLGGVLLNGASVDIPELGDQLNAIVRDNDLSQNAGSAQVQGFGLRLFILRRDLGAPGDSQSSASVHALVQDNRLDANRIGVVIDAGFPYRRVAGVCDTRVYSGVVDLTLAGNEVTGSLLTPALVTFTRSTTALNPAQLPLWQYLHAATFAISDRDGTLAGAWIDHPASDPFLGPCPADSTNETLGNVLIYNGVVLPNGRNF